MNPTRFFSIVAWILLPTVMFGGYSLLNLLVENNLLSDYQVTYFRAGHGHAGVLILMALLYHFYLDQTNFPDRVKWGLLTTLVTGILAVSGGFFLHMAIGQPGQASAGVLITTAGAVILALAILLLVYGLIRHYRTSTQPSDTAAP